ncbi:hypothetical protein OUZ56_008762 [Daphnia magna]|uniref:Uncharacterized protein n=1 Tax=Daphnia magna TaxID=35525 RepID=A0ABR0ADY4_9CRUS|nr:hypothetical protein OUZ56_008762 [Daphnia magna]
MTGFQIQELMKKTTEEFQLSEPRYPFELLIMLLLLVVATTYLSYQTVWLRGRMRAHEQLDVQDDHFLPHLEQVAEGFNTFWGYRSGVLFLSSSRGDRLHEGDLSRGDHVTYA